MEMSIMYLYRSDENTLGLNLLLRNKHQADVNEIMQFGTLASSFAVFAAKGNQISTFHANIVFLSPRVDDMSQDVVHVEQ